MEKKFEQQVQDGEKFEFGKNWQAFISTLNDEKIEIACETLRKNLDCNNANERTFIDVGSGSGLFSLAARKLGFKVFSFDFDQQSIECTKKLKQLYFNNDPAWEITEGSALDKNFVDSLGTYDIVYSWGVLHHTGNMWLALEHVIHLVKPNGQLFVAIYNDEGWQSDFWLAVKKRYNKNIVGKLFILMIFIPFFSITYFLMDILRLKNPYTRYQIYKKNRGMAMYYDWIDWIGGFPFEVATTAELFNFYLSKGFTLTHLHTTNRLGCNELVFKRGH